MLFLNAVSEVCAQTGWMVHAWVIMGNHYPDPFFLPQELGLTRCASVQRALG